MGEYADAVRMNQDLQEGEKFKFMNEPSSFMRSDTSRKSPSIPDTRSDTSNDIMSMKKNISILNNRIDTLEYWVDYLMRQIKTRSRFFSGGRRGGTKRKR